MRWLAMLFLVVAASCGGDDGGPPSLERIQSVCAEWARVGCTKNQQCVGIDETLEQCIAGGTQSCVADNTDASADTCLETRIDAIESCSPRLEAETCEDYCSTGESGSTFCYFPCIYFCPQP
jgi:hypothetical protein